jgi:hypothetical protein
MKARLPSGLTCFDPWSSREFPPRDLSTKQNFDEQNALKILVQLAS